MNVQKIAVNTLATIVFMVLATALFQMWDSTPEMAWSHSQERCVSVMQQGKVVPDGCTLVAQGQLKAERYIVK